MHARILGFDLARAYAILGMYFVNFNLVFGDYTDRSPLGTFLSLFSGNASTVFVMLAGMGVALMSRRAQAGTPELRAGIRRQLHRRAWFLIGLGLLLALWWPADILHFYGAYLHLAALLVFLPPRAYLWAAAGAVLGFHALLAWIPYETGWDFATLHYQDFWTLRGFLRSTFYNGWNPVLPWMAYFLVGMYLGRQDWTQARVQARMAGTGLLLFLAVWALQRWSQQAWPGTPVDAYLQADYLPPFLPFQLSTLGAGLMQIAAWLYLGPRLTRYAWAHDLARAGQHTLSHYLLHLTAGMLLLGALSGQPYIAQAAGSSPVSPGYLLLFAVGYFGLSVYVSRAWARVAARGPFEALMRTLAG